MSKRRLIIPVVALGALLTIGLGISDARAQNVVPPVPIDLPDPELPDGTRRENVNVELWLTISAEGKVSEVSIKSPGGEPFDTAALDAAKRFVFKPATSDGVAIPVKVPFTYRFRKPTRRGRIIPARQSRRRIEPAPGFLLSGVVVERGSRTPQAGVPVQIRDPRTKRVWEVITEEDGRFLADGLPPGKLVVDILVGEFARLEKTVRVDARDEDTARAGGDTFFLNPGGLSAYRTVIRDKKPPKAASVIELTEDELRRVPGTFGDPTRVVASLPGVARSPFGLGFYAVRGANFDNTGFYIDGHPAVFLYHLLGGPGIINPELVGSLSFYPGGYPAEFGRFGAGIVAVETKDPARDRWHLDIELDLFKAAALFSVPFDDEKGIVTFSFRRSYYELLLPAFTEDFNLSFTDYQARVNYEFSPNVRGRFIALGAVDILTAETDTADGAGESMTEFSLGFHRLNARLDIDINKELTWTNSLAWEWDFTNNRRIAEGDDPIDIDISGWFTQLLSYATLRPAKGYKFTAGLDMLLTDYSGDLEVPGFPPLGDPRSPVFNPQIIDFTIDNPTWSFAPYFSGDLELIEGLRLLPGLRVDIQKYGVDTQVSFDPKLAVRYAIDEKWTIKGMGALAHQPPQLFQVVEPFGDATLPPLRSIQASLGAEWKPNDDWFVSAEAFLQNQQNIPRPDDTVEVGEDTGGGVRFKTDEQSRAYGLELLIRKNFGGRFYGWLSYTLSRAERKTGSDPWRTFQLDQTHILNLAWTVRLGNEWSLGARFQLSTGNFFYPIIGSYYDADQDRFQPVYAATQERLPVYHRLDVRLDKRWRFDTWMLEVFLDIQNIYNASNPEAPRYSYDYSESTDGVSIPILPTLGVRAVF